MTPSDSAAPEMTTDDLRKEIKRVSQEELEWACMEAHMQGRLYAQGGEKALPGDEHENMMQRAYLAIRRHRITQRKRSRDAR